MRYVSVTGYYGDSIAFPIYLENGDGLPVNLTNLRVDASISYGSYTALSISGLNKINDISGSVEFSIDGLSWQSIPHGVYSLSASAVSSSGIVFNSPVGDLTILKSFSKSPLIDDTNHYNIQGIQPYDSVISVESISALKSIDVSRIPNEKRFNVAGYYGFDSGGGGDFYWDAYANRLSVIENSGTIFHPSNGASGVWRRFLWNGNIKDFGLTTNPSTIDLNNCAWNNLINYVNTINGADVFIPRGIYPFKHPTISGSTIDPNTNLAIQIPSIPTIVKPIRIKGEGFNLSILSGLNTLNINYADFILEDFTLVGYRNIFGYNLGIAKNVKFDTCDVLRGAPDSIRLNGTNGMLVDGCLFNNFRYAIWTNDQEGQTRQSKNVRVTNSIFENFHENWQYPAGVNFASIKHGIVSNCIFKNINYSGQGSYAVYQGDNLQFEAGDIQVSNIYCENVKTAVAIHNASNVSVSNVFGSIDGFAILIFGDEFGIQGNNLGRYKRNINVYNVHTNGNEPNVGGLLSVGGYTENVNVRDCSVSNSHRPIYIVKTNDGGIRNLRMFNIKSENSNKAGIYLNGVENAFFDEIQIVDANMQNTSYGSSTNIQDCCGIGIIGNSCSGIRMGYISIENQSGYAKYGIGANSTFSGNSNIFIREANFKNIQTSDFFNVVI